MTKEELKEQDIRLNKLCFDYQEKEKRIAELEKENAELQAKNKWYSEQVCNKECAEVWGNLTKAKKIIRELVENHEEYALKTKSKCRKFCEALAKAEAFLKESE